MKTVCVLLAALLLVSYAPAVERWTKTFGGSADEFAWCVLQTADGGYVVSGHTESFGAGDGDYYVVKTDTSGSMVWSKTYGSSLKDGGAVLQPTSDGGYIIAGASLIDTLGDIYVIKTNADGDTTWSKKYDGANDQMSYVAVQTSDGGYIISGNTSSHGAGSCDIYLIKTDSLGDTAWTRTYGGANYEAGWAQPTSDGGYIIWGWTSSSGAGSSDVWLIRTNSSGDTLWTRTYGGTGRDEGSELRPTSDGGYVIVAYTYSRGAGQSDVWLIKTDSTGDTLWTRTFGGTNYDEAYSVAQTSDAGYIIAGQTQSFGAGAGDVWLIKTNSSGDTAWTRTYGGANADVGGAVQQTADGGYVTAGWTSSFGAGGSDIYLIKTDANGSLAVEEERADRKTTAGSLRVVPTPFASFARVLGHEAEQFSLYDISGKLVGTCRGDRVGEKCSPGVYFVSPQGANSGPVRLVKVR